jgi:ABC-2 type transport system permease protein
VKRVNEWTCYWRVFQTFVRNSLVRDMSFRWNFILECVSSVSWVFMNIGFYLVIFWHAKEIGPETGWGKYEFFVFLATTMFVNSLVQAFFMPNMQEFSELIRTGNLDFALLKPIDTQFLVSLHRIEWSSLSNLVVGLGLLVYSLIQLSSRTPQPLHVTPSTVVLYVLYILCGVAIMYSLMIALAATSIWLGRNQSLYNFWFYITNFSRYPMEIYRGSFGTPLRLLFTYLIPVLVVVNVPARIMARPLQVTTRQDLWLPVFALVATAVSLAAARRVFQAALGSYRSASS